MKKYTREELNLIISKHFKWLNDDCGSRANLRGANLRGANLQGADLRGANLRSANLQGVNLRNANLWDANLRGANLQGVNLRDANLRDANLRGANLRSANLQGVNLRDANLWGANLWSLIGNKKNIKSLQLEKYDICYTSEVLQIGCEQHSIKAWFEFSDDEIARMEDGALEWWNKWKVFIKTAIELSPAEPTI